MRGKQVIAYSRKFGGNVIVFTGPEKSQPYTRVDAIRDLGTMYTNDRGRQSEPAIAVIDYNKPHQVHTTGSSDHIVYAFVPEGRK